ncbi:hypothetical protein CSB45_14790 [candidate division KSB3 bacterium]|uniref:Transposase n=1 Tax=candidate division KSB3 bacterium TaxID=2044937 RepID=A0A2G6E158_9BACT|nr:MAG: hypothetical protein CSB45_14790 [candidate division KSB3 bacterium]PIE31090.1 MAG: hypothetical protein CSA57_00305 [candidate division KSB3 bacterium]
MTKRTRRKYSDEFKEEAVKLVTEQSYSIAEASGNLGRHANLLGRWKRGYEQQSDTSTASGNLSVMQAELRRLRKENKKLKMEREILKKAAAFFAKEQEY